MAVPQGDFSKLLRELRSAGPVDRVRLLAKSLAALRGLSPWDRKILLRMAGFEGAEVLVERLAQEDEATGRKLRRLLSDLEGRPEEMERTVRALADPGRRGEALDEILAALDRGLGEEAEAAAAGGPQPHPEAPDAPRESGLPPVPEEPPVPEPSPIPEVPPVPERPARLKPPAPRSRASVQAPLPVAPAPPARTPAARAPARPERELPLAAHPGPRTEAAIESEPLPAPAAVVDAPPRTATALPETPPLALSALPELPGAAADGSPRSAAGILGRLLGLRRRIAAGEGPDARELRRYLETEIPYPWARRRALAAWLEAGPGDLGEALALIELLPGATDRSWCLGTLAEAGPWSEREWERIAAAAPTPTARRRLERRRGS